ncbi:MAG: fatty acid desaturase, partial [Pseudomonadales bacterium]
MSTWTFKSSRARRYHGGAIAYSLLAYGSGWWLLFNGGWVGFLPGVLFLGHGMIIAAYLIHECAHNTLFKSNRHNGQIASLLGWICGSCYGTFKDIRTKHFRHHVENDDVVWFDYEAFFIAHPVVYRITI